jgi:hypothetical protein
MDHKSYGKVHLYQAVLILHQSYHGDYAYPGGRVAISNDDGMTFDTQVPAGRCTWVHVAVFCLARHLMLPLPENPTPLVLI